MFLRADLDTWQEIRRVATILTVIILVINLNLAGLIGILLASTGIGEEIVRPIIYHTPLTLGFVSIFVLALYMWRRNGCGGDAAIRAVSSTIGISPIAFWLAAVISQFHLRLFERLNLIDYSYNDISIMYLNVWSTATMYSSNPQIALPRAAEAIFEGYSEIYGIRSIAISFMVAIFIVWMWDKIQISRYNQSLLKTHSAPLMDDQYSASQMITFWKVEEQQFIEKAKKIRRQMIKEREEHSNVFNNSCGCSSLAFFLILTLGGAAIALVTLLLNQEDSSLTETVIILFILVGILIVLFFLFRSLKQAIAEAVNLITTRSERKQVSAMQREKFKEFERTLLAEADIRRANILHTQMKIQKPL